MFRFESTLAIRHLRSGGGQSLLTLFAVAAGVVVIVFISAITFGVRALISSRLTDFVPNVRVELPDVKPPILSTDPQHVSAKVELQAQQLKFITHWKEAAATISTIPNVRVVAPTVAGAGFAGHGGKQVGCQVFGADPDKLVQIMPLNKYLTGGHYLGLRSEEVFITQTLAKHLDVKVGDRIRLTSSEGLTAPFTIVGIYDPGQDMPFAFVTLRSAQSLYATQNGVHMLYVGTNGLFTADSVADRIQALLPYKATSWSREYPQFVSMIAVYAAMAYLISAFSLIASAFAIASVLIVSVMQKGKEIGILKSIGARPKQILTVFVMEGFGIAIVGSTIGAAVGTVMVKSLTIFKQTPWRAGPPEDLLPTYLTPTMITVAMIAAILATVLASAFPARRAAAMDPVQVMK